MTVWDGSVTFVAEKDESDVNRKRPREEQEAQESHVHTKRQRTAEAEDVAHGGVVEEVQNGEEEEVDDEDAEYEDVLYVDEEDLVNFGDDYEVIYEEYDDDEEDEELLRELQASGEVAVGEDNT